MGERRAGHGPAVSEPAAWIDYYLSHRSDRLRAVADAAHDRGSGADLAGAAADAEALDDLVQRVVERVYADVPQQLWPAAALSVTSRPTVAAAPVIAYEPGVAVME